MEEKAYSTKGQNLFSGHTMVNPFQTGNGLAFDREAFFQHLKCQFRLFEGRGCKFNKID